MMRKPIERLVLAACLAAAPAHALAQRTRPASRPAPAPVLLGDRYVDRLSGFSVCAPAGGRLNREFSPDRLVHWTAVNPKTGASVWTLSLRRVKGNFEKVGLETYARALADRMRTEEDFHISAVTHHSVGGRKAVHFRGKTAGMLKLWRYETWLVTGPGKFFVIAAVGPEKLEAELGALCRAVAGTLLLTDPQTAREEARENLRRGERLLAGLTDEKLAARMPREDRWYLLRSKGKVVGFRKVSELRATEKGAAGFQVTTWGLLQIPGQEARLAKRVMFTTADRRLERWKEQFQIGSGTRARSVAEDGFKQAELIVCSIDRGGTIDARQQTIPIRDRLVEAMKMKGMPEEKIKALAVPAYLPRVMGQMLGRLVDLKTPASYSFATFNSATGDLDLRTFTVVGPERITLGGAPVRAVRVTDRLSPEQEAVAAWLDETGRALRVQAAGSVTMEHSTATAVTAHFPKVRESLKGMATWASQE